MKNLLPYIKLTRLNQPIGIWLLLWPCLWGVAFASHYVLDIKLLVLFTLGAIIMRSAGCIINDLADKDIDAQVTRTQNRPLASGELSSKQALVLLAVLLAAGLVILLMFNRITIILGISSLLLVIAYPFMKRITYWPQAFLGLTFNWGALMGWTAVTGKLELPALVLYAACICWTLGYDTIYAHQDKESDALIGVKSTALRFGEKTKTWLAAFYKIFAILLIAVPAIIFARENYHMQGGYFLSWCLVAAHLYWQVKTVDIDDPADCLKKFRSNSWLGALVFVGILLGKI
jgi:4-hydroxybenzoate polyprenyltransferase